jgi:phosphoribosylformylglycinamidine synthase
MVQPWESDYGKPERIASALDIMIEGPIGAAAFNNEFGRPNLAGYFRTFEQEFSGEMRGYHKPIMIAGGLGNIAAAMPSRSSSRRRAADPARRPRHADRSGRRRGFVDGHRHQHRRPRLRLGAARQPGDPAPRPGSHRPLLADGGEESRSWPSTTSAPAAFPTPCRNWPTAPAAARASTARRALRGAGHVAARDLVQRGAGALRAGHRPRALDEFRALCERERCPFAVLGTATGDGRLTVKDEPLRQRAVDMDMEVLLGKPPRDDRNATARATCRPSMSPLDLKDAAWRVLRMPAWPRRISSSPSATAASAA